MKPDEEKKIPEPAEAPKPEAAIADEALEGVAGGGNLIPAVRRPDRSEHL